MRWCGRLDVLVYSSCLLLPMGQTVSSLQIQVSYQGQLKFDCVSAAKTGHIEEHGTFAFQIHLFIIAWVGTSGVTSCGKHVSAGRAT